MTLREYQNRALDEVAEAHRELTRVCCVMPTGAGKSVLARAWARRQVDAGRAKGLILAHRIELLRQMRGHLAEVGIAAGIMSPEERAEPWLTVQCASLDTIVARGAVPEAEWVIVDECHHIVADTWRPVVEAQPNALVLGLTATPQRGDGRPLGDVFQKLVVGAQYSELLAAGHLVPCKVHRPAEYQSSDLATDPVEAYLKHGEGKRGFAFCRNVTESKQLAADLRTQGVRAENVDGAMSAKRRAEILDRFRAGELDILTNVHVLTEGFDVPSAEVCLLARGAGNAGTYLQMVGRVLRPAPGKRYAIFIDLPGVSHEHGFPTADREYALSGRAIKTCGESLRNCLECGCTCPSSARACIECGTLFPRRIYQGPKIWNLELLEYFENVGELHTAPKSLKQLEWDRLLGVCESKGFGVGFAVQEFEKIFKEAPEAFAKALPDEIKRAELKRLLKIQTERNLQVGWISHAYRGTFGAFPSRALRESAGVPVPQEGMR